MRLAALTCALAATALVACAKAPPTSSKSASAAAPVASPAPLPAQDAVQEKKPRLPEAATYIDGKPVAAIHALELPTSLKLHDSPVGSPRFYMGEYLTALGIDLAKIKAVHIYGGSRVVAIDGDEFRRVQNGIQFNFSRGTGGKPKVMFVVAKLKANSTIDMMSGLAVYVDKKPPHLIEYGQLAFDDGKPIVGMPYAERELSKGTRVYVDGKLAATVKRKELPTDIAVDADPSNPHFSLPGYLKSIGIDAKQAKAMDFVREDEVILRMDSSTKDADSFAFSLPRHNQGHIAVPAGDAKAAKVSALQIFIKTPPPARTIVLAKDDVRDDANQNPGGGQGGGGGGADDEL